MNRWPEIPSHGEDLFEVLGLVVAGEASPGTPLPVFVKSDVMGTLGVI